MAFNSHTHTHTGSTRSSKATNGSIVYVPFKHSVVELLYLELCPSLKYISITEKVYTIYYIHPLQGSISCGLAPGPVLSLFKAVFLWPANQMQLR